MDYIVLKNQVKKYWNQASCGTEVTNQEKFSTAYFQEIEHYRYRIEPEIFSFAQFTRLRGKKVLEIGVGAGTDFIQWVRAGAHAYGVDLTHEAIDHISKRLSEEGLRAYDLQVADAEQLPYPDSSFDLSYSWGVIHHSPDTQKCLQEMIRVTKPGGLIKLMIYHRWSLFAFYRYFLAAFLKGKPFRSLQNVLFYDQESIGTKAYTFKEARSMIAQYPVDIISICAPVTKHDLLWYKSLFFRLMAYSAACVFGWRRAGWYMMIELKKRY